MPHSSMSAHIGHLFTEVPLRERIAVARAAGFDADEQPRPAIHTGRRACPPSARRGHGLPANVGGNRGRGRSEKGLAALPGREAEFREAFLRALDYAETAGCPLVHPMAGVLDGSVSEAAATATYTTNLVYAVGQCRGARFRSLSRPSAMKRYRDISCRASIGAASLTEAVEPSAIAARRYFPCRSRRHPVSRPFVAAHAGRIGHGHVADHPGRHEPGTGTLDFEAFVRLIVSRGYPRAVSFEYIPSRPTAETLALTPAWKGRLRDYAGDT